MNNEEIANKYGGTMCALNSYISMGIFIREYGFENDFSCIDYYKRIYESCTDEEERKKLEQRIDIMEFMLYRELFERTFLAIEDYSAILSSLSLELEKFHINVAKNPSAEKTLGNLTEVKLKKILKYKDLSFMELDDRNYIESLRKETLDSMIKLAKTVLNFYKINKTAYNRMKHGNSLFYSRDKIMIDNVPTYIIPVEYNPKAIENVDLLILNKDIFNATLNLLNHILANTRMVCEINRDYISYGEHEFEIGALPYDDGLSQKKVDEIFGKYPLEKINYVDISTTLKLTGNGKKIKTILNFYKSIKKE